MSDEPHYMRALVSFVDVLGFRDLVSSANVPEILDVLRRKDMLTLHWQHGFNAIPGTTVTFSDLIVNVTPMTTPLSLHALFEQLVSLGFRQFLLAKKGIFVRGGVTIGEIYVDSRSIFGPALITAYDLERSTAKWPIIALDPALVQDIETLIPQYIADRYEREGEEGHPSATPS